MNLTDGLDGLAIGCTVVAAGALTVLTYVSGHAVFADYLELQKMPQVGGVDRLLRVHGRREHWIPVV